MRTCSSCAFFYGAGSLNEPAPLFNVLEDIAKEKNEMKLLVRNLARNTTQEELKAAFAKFGSIQSCTLVMDKETGESKGFGFVEMPKVGDAKLAIKSLNGAEIDGAKIRVKKAEEAGAAPQE